VEIFNNEVGKTSLDYVWKTYGQKAHEFAAFEYILFLSIFTFNIYSFDLIFINKNAASFTIAWIIQIVVLIYVTIYLAQEVQEIRTINENEVINKVNDSIYKRTVHVLREHFKDLWNVVDIMIILLTYLGIIIRLFMKTDTRLSLISLASASILIWFKILYFLRPFLTSGPLGI
jgi:hypothetical protein